MTNGSIDPRSYVKMASVRSGVFSVTTYDYDGGTAFRMNGRWFGTSEQEAVDQLQRHAEMGYQVRPQTLRVYDGTQETSKAAWDASKRLRSESAALAGRAAELLRKASEIQKTEEARHRIPSPEAEYAATVWDALSLKLENIAGALGGGDPKISVTYDPHFDKFEFEHESVGIVVQNYIAELNEQHA